MSGKRLTDDERERIVELKLSHVGERDIAADVGCSRDSVRRWWSVFCEANAEAIANERTRYAGEFEVRARGIMAAARHVANMSTAPRDITAALGVELRALELLGKATGVIEFDYDGAREADGLTDADAVRLLSRVPAVVSLTA